MAQQQWQLSGSPGEIYERYMVRAVLTQWADHRARQTQSPGDSPDLLEHAAVTCRSS
jgi:hypothetical protein